MWLPACCVVPRREATAVPACRFGIAAIVHALITSPLRGGVGVFEAAPPTFLQAAARPLQVSCYLSLFFNSARSSNDPTEPCPSQPGIGAETTVLGQSFNLQFPGESELDVSPMS